MSVVFNAAIAGTVSADNPAINVQFPGTQEISISGPGDTITPVDDTGAYVALATKANQVTANTSLASIDSKLSSPVAVSGPLTNAQLRASPVPVSGTITSTPSGTQDVNVVSSVEIEIKNDTGNPIPVSGTFFQTTQPVSAASLPLPSGASTAANQATANTSLSSIDSKLTSPLAVTGPLTDTQLRASRVPVDGSGVTQPISGSVSVSNFPATQPVSGTVTANAGTGTFTVDGSGHTQPISASSLPLPTGAATSANQSTEITALGTINTTLGSPMQQSGGSVTANAGSGTFAVSAASLPLPSGAATEATLALIKAKTDNLDVLLSTRTKPADTQTVSGTVTANAGSGTFAVSAASLPLPSGAATSANQATEITALGTINTTLGSPFQAGGAISNTSFTATQGTATNLKTQAENYQGGAAVGSSNPLQVTLANTGANATAVKIDGSAVTQPVSAASLPLPSGAATAANQSTANTSLSSIDSKLTSPLTVTSTGVSKATYGAAATFTAAASATDIFTITGSGTKTVKVLHIGINGTNTGNTNVFFNVIKRSTANSGGTSTTITDVPFDSTDAAGTATVRSYTVNPTTGTAVGTVKSDYAFFPTLASTNQGTNIQHEFDSGLNKPVVLRGTSEVLAVSMNGVLITGTTSLSIDIIWTEE